VAVKVVHVSDLSGQQGAQEEFARLIVHEHPGYSTPITLEVLPGEVADLPDESQYVSIELVQPGERSGRRAIVSLEAFDALAGEGSDMNGILMNALAASHQQRGQQRGQEARRGSAVRPARRERIDYATLEHAGRPHRGRITDAEKTLVRGNLDTINARLRSEGQREIDPNDDTLKERYGL
jgi:hypothetical protein